jgi:hypothetical protein
VYEAKAVRESAPITKAQIDGKEPLRTFGALKQLFVALSGGADEADTAPPAGSKGKKRREKSMPAVEAPAFEAPPAAVEQTSLPPEPPTSETSDIPPTAEA